MSHFAAPPFVKSIPLPDSPPVRTSTLDPQPTPVLQVEYGFYSQYKWCLNPFLTIRDVIRHLREELDRLIESEAGWQLDEICKNIFLLSCSITDSVDDHLLGRAYDFSKITNGIPPLSPIVSLAERLYSRAGKSSFGNSKSLARWRYQWQLAVVRALGLLHAGRPLDKQGRADIRTALGPLLTSTSLDALLHRRIRIPGAFRSQDLTHFDVLALGRKFISKFPERQNSVVIMGLRTAGSYFAPLLRSYLESHNYSDVDSLTIRPKLGAGKEEMIALARCAAQKSTLVIIDEPVGSGSTLLKAVQLAQRCSVDRQKMVILVPIHPSFRLYKDKGSSYALLSDISTFTLEPEEWYKYDRLDAATEEFVKEYFQSVGGSVRAVSRCGALTDRFNESLEASSDQKGHTRLKHVYEVRVSNQSGCAETRYVLAKSVGWGWLSYHAFLAGERLARFVSPILGLRNGILYTEWQDPDDIAASKIERSQWIDRAASYIAARVRTLPLEDDPAPELISDTGNNGLWSLVSNLCQAYGARPVQYLRRGRMRHELSRAVCPCPTLIDGRMRPLEWVRGKTSLLKSDFEHHALGKIEINMTDPAYDLADAMLTWQLSLEEEEKLVARYIQESGDVNVADRLLLNKFVAGIRVRRAAIGNLEDARLIHRSEEFNREYIAAWNFLVLHTMRYCAKLCSPPERTGYHSPLVVLDVDGVLDKQILGFPSTTWAGIRAVSLLHSHGLATVLNTARSIPEVKDYCRHYGFLGGVAEYGAFAWDAGSNREEILVSQESLDELRLLAEHLRKIPGVFLNEDYTLSIRAYTFEGEITRALPTPLIRNLVSQLKLNRLSYHQTYTDTAVLAKETDKGRGLLALLALIGQPSIETLAIGDSEADLPMFKAAKRSFAPGNVTCRSQARAIGCHIEDKSFQNGLLNIVRHILHPDGDGCERCRSAEPPTSSTQNLVLRVLQHADEGQMKRFLRTICDSMVTSSFLAN